MTLEMIYFLSALMTTVSVGTCSFVSETEREMERRYFPIAFTKRCGGLQ